LDGEPEIEPDLDQREWITVLSIIAPSLYNPVFGFALFCPDGVGSIFLQNTGNPL
jgi:hypothetical protein